MNRVEGRIVCKAASCLCLSKLPIVFLASRSENPLFPIKVLVFFQIFRKAVNFYLMSFFFHILQRCHKV